MRKVFLFAFAFFRRKKTQTAIGRYTIGTDSWCHHGCRCYSRWWWWRSWWLPTTFHSWTAHPQKQLASWSLRGARHAFKPVIWVWKGKPLVTEFATNLHGWSVPYPGHHCCWSFVCNKPSFFLPEQMLTGIPNLSSNDARAYTTEVLQTERDERSLPTALPTAQSLAMCTNIYCV